MANKVISLEIVIPGGTKSITTLEELQQAINEVRESLSKLKSTDADFSIVSKNFGALKNLAKEFALEIQRSGQVAADSYRGIKAELQQLINQYEQLSKVDRQSEVGVNLLKNITNLRQELKKVDAEIKGTLNDQQFPIGSYRAMSAELTRLRNEYKNLDQVTRDSAVGQKIAKDAQLLARNLQDLDAKLGNYQRNVGNYRSALGNVADIFTFGLATGGIIQAVQLLDTAIKAALANTINFSRQLSTIKAVSGASAEELALVEAEIVRVGASSEFTTQEVAQLAIEYSKLGFTASEIIDVLAATTDVATVSGEGLAEVASTIGSVLNIFGLDAKDAASAGDILAGAFNKTALSLQTFNTGISIVGPASKAVGVDLKTTAALLGILADNSIDASTAGTSLRNIFIETANSGRSLQEAFDLINNAQNKLAVANALFGKDASVVAITLAEQQNELVGLIGELSNVERASKSAADVMRQDLKGAFDELTGATEAFGIAAIQANQEGITSLVKGLTDLVRFFTNLISGESEASKKLNELKTIIVSLLPVIAAFTLAVAINSKTLAFNTGVAIGRWIASLSRLIGITRLITIAQYAWNLAMNLNPIGIVITAVGALVTAITYAYTSTSNFAKLLRQVFEFVADLGKKLLLIFNPALYVETFVLGSKLLKKTNDKTQEDITRKNEEERRKREKADNEYIERNKKSLKSLGLFTETVGETINKNFKLDSKALEKSAEEARKGLEKELAPEDALSFDKFDLDNLRRRAAFQYGTKGDKDTATELEKLTKRQNELKDAIQNSIVTGKPYADLLTDYYDITFKINTAEKEWEDQLAKLDLAVNAAAGSVEFYKQKIGELEKQLKNAPSGAIQKIVGDLDKAEKDLATAETAIKRLQRAASNSSFTELLETDIQPFEEKIKKRKELAEEEADRTIRDEEVLAKTKTIIQLSADIQIWEARKALYREGSKEFSDIERRLADLRSQLGVVDSFKKQAELIAAIEVQANSQALKVKKDDYDEYLKAIKIIDLQKNVAILKTKLANEKLNYADRLALLKQYNDAVNELNAATDTNNDPFALDTKTKNLLIFVNATLDQIANLGDSVNQLLDTQTESRIKGVEDYYQKEIDAAKGNKELIEKLEKEKAAKIDDIRRADFERKKKFEIAAASISYAQGIINVLTAPTTIPDPFGAAYKTIQLAVVTAQYAIQLANIRSKTYAEGGYTGSGFGQPDHTGFKRAGWVHEGEYVIPKRILKTAAGAKLANTAERMRTGHSLPNYSNYAVGGFVLPASQNDIISSRGNTIYQLTLTDEQIDKFAGTVADEVGDSVENAIIEGLREATLEAQRRRNLQIQTG